MWSFALNRISSLVTSVLFSKIPEVELFKLKLGSKRGMEVKSRQFAGCQIAKLLPQGGGLQLSSPNTHVFDEDVP